MPLIIPITLLVFFLGYFVYSIIVTPWDLLSSKLTFFFCWWAIGYLSALCIATVGVEMSGDRNRILRHIVSAIAGILGLMMIAPLVGFALITLNELYNAMIYNKEYKKYNKDLRKYE